MSIFVIPIFLLLSFFSIGSWLNAYRNDQEELKLEQTEWQSVLERANQTRKFPRVKQRHRGEVA